MSKFLSRLAVGVVLIASQAAQAEPIIDFGVLPNNGTIAFNPSGANALVGSNIDVDNVEGVGTPLNSGLANRLFLTNGVLNFTSGTFTGSSMGMWFFGGGGPITIQGDDGLGPGFRTLLSGTITSATVIPLIGSFKVAVAAFMNTVDPTLAAYFGLSGGPGTQYIGGVNLQFTATGTAPGGFTSRDSLSGNVTTTPAPEPGTLALAGVAVVGGLAWRRRRGRAFGLA